MKALFVNALSALLFLGPFVAMAAYHVWRGWPK